MWKYPSQCIHQYSNHCRDLLARHANSTIVIRLVKNSYMHQAECALPRRRVVSTAVMKPIQSPRCDRGWSPGMAGRGRRRKRRLVYFFPPHLPSCRFGAGWHDQLGRIPEAGSVPRATSDRGRNRLKIPSARADYNRTSKTAEKDKDREVDGWLSCHPPMGCLKKSDSSQTGRWRHKNRNGWSLISCALQSHKDYTWVSTFLLQHYFISSLHPLVS